MNYTRYGTEGPGPELQTVDPEDSSRGFCTEVERVGGLRFAGTNVLLSLRVPTNPNDEIMLQASIIHPSEDSQNLSVETLLSGDEWKHIIADSFRYYGSGVLRGQFRSPQSVLSNKQHETLIRLAKPIEAGRTLQELGLSNALLSATQRLGLLVNDESVTVRRAREVQSGPITSASHEGWKSKTKKWKKSDDTTSAGFNNYDWELCGGNELAVGPDAFNVNFVKANNRDIVSLWQHPEKFDPTLSKGPPSSDVSENECD